MLKNHRKCKELSKKTSTLLDSPKFENSKTVLEYDPDGEAIWKEIMELDAEGWNECAV